MLSKQRKVTVALVFVLTTSLCCALTSQHEEDDVYYVRQLHETLTSSPASQVAQGPPLRTSGNSPLPQCVVPEDVTILTSSSMPSNKNYIPEVGNGHVATVVQSDTIFMNGLYNGASIVSHRARIPSTAGYNITSVTPSGFSRQYSLDLGRGIFTESYTWSGLNVSLRTYAHRLFTTVLVNELVLERTDDNTTDVQVTVTLNSGPPSVDLTLTNLSEGLVHGQTLAAEFKDVAPTTDFYVRTSPSIEGTFSLSPNVKAESYVRLTVIDVDLARVNSEYDQAQAAFLSGQLLNLHVNEWNSIWQKGRIDVKGDVTIARHNYGTLYYLLSSLPSNGNRKDWPFIGLSPGGLAHGIEGKDYYGHVFWDQDTWMFPPIALLHSDIGKTIVETRTKTLATARMWASATGYDGARYPWESAFTGLETCPAIPVGVMEIHINGDVAMMVRQYWQLTQDTELMVNGSGADIVWDTARYWATRVAHNTTDDSYRILNVMPPDEFHSPVNDSVYTNSIAALNLRFANQLASYFGQPENTTWSTISDKLRILYDPVLDYHPEYDGFTLNESTKQADVVLLGFPLMAAMNESTRRNDMINYEKTTPTGNVPAMTWGVFLIGWLDLGDEVKAAQLFHRSVLNSQEPFLVWSENADGTGAANFLTGMGGYLQLVLFGYGGCRIYDDMLTFSPVLINGTSEVKFTGVDYRGSSFDLTYTSDNLTLTQTAVSSGHLGLEVRLGDAGAWQKLKTGIDLNAKRQKFQIRNAEN
nr:acid trehalase-like protein 1 [Biomphalaria glabrata]